MSKKRKHRGDAAAPSQARSQRAQLPAQHREAHSSASHDFGAGLSSGHGGGEGQDERDVERIFNQVDSRQAWGRTVGKEGRAEQPRKRHKGAAAAADKRGNQHWQGASSGRFHPRSLARYHDLPPELRKYYNYRYELFSLYDAGISLDATSWFSVTPESVAARIAERCRCNTILDAFGGAGGNAIQFAKVCERVVAVEIDPIKVEMARHNARIYGVEDRITFVTGDVREFAEAHRRARQRGAQSAAQNGEHERWLGAERLDFDVVFLSPPWGGPTYVQTTGAATSALPAGAEIPKKPANSRERRLSRRKAQQEHNQANSITDETTASEGIDSALAAQLGLPLTFAGRFTDQDYEAHEQSAPEGYDATEVLPEAEIVGDITATPWYVSDQLQARQVNNIAFSNTYSLTRLEPMPGSDLVALARSLCAAASGPEADDAKLALASTGGNNIALYLPRNIDLDELALLGCEPAKSSPRNTLRRRPAAPPRERASSEDDTDSVSEASSDNQARQLGNIHLEECWLNGRLKAVCAYFGELASAWDTERDGWVGA
ncbi:putative diacylglycerol O-acyltransferase tgs1 [Tilletia horrida]|uniref:Trimethylguanosine synthase n=1 Tax=Tilletia horrida TaxID=155126 RepID=A0AAN6G8N8_9BASI|nr:putative diacylglycerol O-acyltransferase tgs1 [Tilletia horrida]